MSAPLRLRGLVHPGLSEAAVEHGASEHAVALMRRTVGDRLGVKASGGIRDRAAAEAMVAAGASRLGLSSSRAVLEGGTGSAGY